MATERDELPCALIGAGPAGLAGARNLSRFGIEFVGFEAHTGVGGLWDIDNPDSTVYRSAHLISSKTTTAFDEFPMADGVADYPSHRELLAYFDRFADRFDLRRHFRFGRRVVRAEPGEGGRGWEVTVRDGDGAESTEAFGDLIIANGNLSSPNVPEFAGEFEGELMHTSAYKDPEIFAGKRVLVVGAGNSGCDIAVDAVHHADSVEMSVRSGYYFFPKYIFGRPSDTFNEGRPLPAWLKTRIDSRLLRMFTPDPTRLGFPAPDHRIYESHPVLNTLVLHHAGHGDIRVRADVDRFDGGTVRFADGGSGAYDMIVLATGYRLSIPFIDGEHLNWRGPAPDLHLNIFTPAHRDLFMLGMVEAAGIGWQGRHQQAELIARFMRARDAGSPRAEELWQRVLGPRPDLSGGYRYRQLRRMPYYVNKHAYRSAVAEHIGLIGEAS